MSSFDRQTTLLGQSLVVLLLLTFMVANIAAAADLGWVRSYVRLNLRAGAGTQFKILESVETGDQLEILERTETWTLVTTKDGKRGWIPAGYLDTVPPPTLRLEQLESETASLRAELEEIRTEAAQLRETNATLTAADSGQRAEIESLKIDNYELQAGSRYTEWITGALILSIGMLVGAFLHRNSTRRPSSRIRL